MVDQKIGHIYITLLSTPAVASKRETNKPMETTGNDRETGKQKSECPSSSQLVNKDRFDTTAKHCKEKHDDKIGERETNEQR